MTTVTLRISENEVQYLESIAPNLLLDSSKQQSLGKVLKALLTWCQKNKFDPSNLSDTTDSSRKLIEQLHVSVPHMLYLLRLHVLLDSDKISDDVVLRSKQQAIDYINAVCGDFQNVDYKEIKSLPNDEGLKQLPVKKETSQWNMKK